MKCTKNVTDETLLKDIEYTVIEAEAYRKLEEGFLSLYNLPENKDNGFIPYRFLYENSKFNKEECLNFLLDLSKLKIERGL